ncbi:hypothetical protein GGR52DRAFT_560613 [Hypoxylon sp. FL1284]|nr:hypothetical protein GGR52DRAFT_560613 [Hypoxylon sp. FL1284]
MAKSQANPVQSKMREKKRQKKGTRGTEFSYTYATGLLVIILSLLLFRQSRRVTFSRGYICIRLHASTLGNSFMTVLFFLTRNLVSLPSSSRVDTGELE